MDRSPAQVHAEVHRGHMALEHPKKILSDVLRPAQKRREEAEEFRRVLHEYETSLNTAVWDKSLHGEQKDIVESAQFVVGVKGVRKSLNPSEDPESADKAIEIHTKKIFEWYKKLHPGTADLMTRYVQGDPQKEEKLHQMIGENLSHWITIRQGLGVTAKGELQQKYVSETGSFLLSQSPRFVDLSAFADGEYQNVEDVLKSAIVDEETSRLHPHVDAFEMRDWVARTAKESRTGRRVYETPYYRNLIDEIDFKGRTKNGVGGIILYGPPGTGKTEVLREKNREQGFDTRVINIHHYTSFADLIADKAIQVGVSQGADIVKQTESVLSVFEGQTPEQFAKDVAALVDVLKKEGKLRNDETVEDFVSSFVSDDAAALLKKDTVTLDDWQRVKDSFVQSQRVRVLRTTLPASYQEVLEDIVRGEILHAIKNGQRVVLDELDKAGPNSLGGLLTFLGSAKGTLIEYGNTQMTIPPWFMVDATSNSTELSDYLTNRFSGMRVDMPPIKDQLMIASVKIADDQGNVLLDEHDQRQLAAFFIYLVPPLNAILMKNGSNPLSNRDIQHLTSYLVDFDNMKPTGKSVGEAVRSLVKERSILAKSDTIAQEVDSIAEYRFLQENRPYDFTSSPQPVALDRHSRLQRGLEQTAESPLFEAINGLEEPSGEEFRIATVLLSSGQQVALQEGLKKQKRAQVRADMVKLPIGLALEKNPDDGRKISFVAVPSSAADRTQVLFSAALPDEGRFVAASPDGRSVVLSSPSGTDGSRITKYHVFAEKPANVLPDNFVVPDGAEVRTDRNVRNVSFLDRASHTLSLAHGKNVQTVSNVVRYEIAENGRMLLLERADGTSALVSPENLQTVLARLPGTGWKFASDKLLVREENGIVATDALLAA